MRSNLISTQCQSHSFKGTARCETAWTTLGLSSIATLNANSSLVLKSVGGDMYSHWSEGDFMLLVREMKGGKA